MSAEITVKKDKTRRAKLNELREKRKKLITQVREHEKERDAKRAARDELNKKVRELFDAARVEKEARDEINKDVQLNKELRKMSQEDADKVFKQLEELRAEVKGIHGGERNLKKIAQRIKDIEFKIETDAKLTKEKEEEYIDELRSLHEKFSDLEVASEKQTEIRAINDKWKAHRDNARMHHKKVKELAEQSQAHHDQMLEYINEARKLRSEADETHNEVKEISATIKEIRQQITAVSKDADLVRKELGEETMVERQKRRKEEEIKAKKETQVTTAALKKKMNDGGRLDLEELKILLEQGEVFNDK